MSSRNPWVCMGGIFPKGRFPNGRGEDNLMGDTSASVRAVNDWPTPVVFSGFEIGARIKNRCPAAGDVHGKSGASLLPALQWPAASEEHECQPREKTMTHADFSRRLSL